MSGSPPRLEAGAGIALALGGGAALGWAHIGALRVLAEARITVGAVAGTSMGALVGLCLAADRLDALEEIARSVTPRRMLGHLDPLLGRGALLGGRRIARELERHFGALRLEALPVPVALVAADLASGREARLTHGFAISAVRASMALPGIFRPVEIDGRRLIDGGMVATLPVAAARAIAPGLPVVAIDVLGDYRARGVRTRLPRSAMATTRAAFLMMIAAQTRAALVADPPAVLVRPRVGHLSTGDFVCGSELIALGAEAMRAMLPEVAALVPAAAK